MQLQLPPDQIKFQQNRWCGESEDAVEAARLMVLPPPVIPFLPLGLGHVHTYIHKVHTYYK